MPRPRVGIYWQERIRELTEQNPKMGSSEMAQLVQEEAKRLGRDDWPSEKAARNYVAIHREAPEHERRQYRFVYWPESFGTPELPWESAPVVLEAIRIFPEGSRPTVRVAKWCWRLTLAGLAPASPGERLLWALLAEEYERSDAPPEAWRGLEQHLLQPEMEEPPIFSAYLNDLKRAAEAAARLGRSPSWVEG